MNLQRREEIRALSASLRMMPLNEAASAIDELLAHIDTLEQTAAERVIAGGSRGPTPDYTGEGSALVPTAADFTKIELGFGRVEVGEGTWMGVPALIFGKNGNGVVGKPTAAGSRFLNADECLAVVTFANVESLDVLLGKLMKCRSDRFPNAIPADRVLGEGERRICSEELMYLQSLERYARKHGPESIQDVIGCLDHLRANQGGM